LAEPVQGKEMMLRILRHIYKLFFSGRQKLHHDDVVQTATTISEPEPLLALTCEVEKLKRDFDLADKALRKYRATHSFDLGPEFEAARIAARDAQYRLETALHQYNKLRKQLGLTSELQGGKNVRKAN
jgi:hypothetical protein